jgi:ribosomal protein S18 acetylase RimI-like enzyme
MQLRKFDDFQLVELMSWFPDAHACRVWGGPQFRFPFTPATFRDDAKIDSLPTWMLVDAGKMVAFGQYYLRIGRCHLGRLAVMPHRRGRGIGAALVRELCARGAAEFGVDEFSLFVLPGNERARRLYERLGFVPDRYPEDSPLYADCIYMIQRAKSAAKPSM